MYSGRTRSFVSLGQAPATIARPQTLDELLQSGRPITMEDIKALPPGQQPVWPLITRDEYFNKQMKTVGIGLGLIVAFTVANHFLKKPESKG